ncbi:MAG: hypothetical protein ACQEUZ_07765 [Pseudomonadota bacterium]
MAKGQKRSNREVKKPKQPKAAAPAPVNPLVARLTEAQDRAKKGRK